MFEIKKAWCFGNNGVPLDSDEVRRLISVVPSERQQEFAKMEFYCFIHFGMNTVTNREWGTGKENPAIFNPMRLNTDQWCETIKNIGAKGVIITAKHHDGFCLWNTKQTSHSVMNSPYGKDIVRLLRESCDKYGLKLGIYLSPWDRHEEKYGTPEYNDYFVAQLTELCENYGEIFTFWFDGACGEGKNGKKQEYDWKRYYSLIREKQPQAVISICGPDVRWIGNEGGNVRKSEWCVVPAALSDNDKTMELSQQDENQAQELANIDALTDDVGSRELLRQYKNLIWWPAEADVSVTTGWFWHNSLYYLFKKKRTAKQLADIYFNTVGGNASLLLNIPPDKNGLVSKRELKTLAQFKKRIDSVLSRKLQGAKITLAKNEGTERTADFEKDSVMLENGEYGLRIKFEKPQKTSALSIREDIRFSQRVESFALYVKTADGYKKQGDYTVIGTRKIIRLKKAYTDEILLVITQSRSNPVIGEVSVYGNR